MIVAGVLFAFGCDENGDTDAGTPGDDASMTDGGPGTDSGPMESCSDGIMNQDESDVDCGGTCGATCTPGDMCGGNGDCTTDMCNAGVCEGGADVHGRHDERHGDRRRLRRHDVHGLRDR